MTTVNIKANEKIISLVLSVVFFTTFASYSYAGGFTTKPVKSAVPPVVAPVVQEKVKTTAELLATFASIRDPVNDKQLAELLSTVGFKGERLKEAWSVAQKESRANPLDLNSNSSTGDNSFGLFQINMIGDLGTARRIAYGLASNDDLFNPVLNAQIAYQMSDGGKNWGSWKVGRGYNGYDQSKYLMWYQSFPEGSF